MDFLNQNLIYSKTYKNLYIKGNLKKIIGSLNQQYVFNRQKKPSYARKMKTVMNIVRKRLGKKKDG